MTHEQSYDSSEAYYDYHGRNLVLKTDFDDDFMSSQQKTIENELDKQLNDIATSPLAFGVNPFKILPPHFIKVKSIKHSAQKRLEEEARQFHQASNPKLDLHQSELLKILSNTMHIPMYQ